VRVCLGLIPIVCNRAKSEGPFMAHSGHAQCVDECPLLGVKRTLSKLLTNLDLSVHGLVLWGTLTKLSDLRRWVAVPYILKVSALSDVQDQLRTETNDTLTTGMSDAAIANSV
jgi:hypothetical protein